jgi:hypothetical protein
MKKKHSVNQTSSHIIKYVGELSNQVDMQPTMPHSVYQRHLLVKSVSTQTTFLALCNTPSNSLSTIGTDSLVVHLCGQKLRLLGAQVLPLGIAKYNVLCRRLLPLLFRQSWAK